MNKNPFLALVLGLIPGLGHLYLKKFGRFILYSGGALFLFILAAFCTIALGARDIAFLSLFLLVVLWAINLLDLVITIINQSKNKQPENLQSPLKKANDFISFFYQSFLGLVIFN